MFRLALGNLTQNKTRFLLSVGGLALALTLVLFFGAVIDGATNRITVYIDRAGADVWVSQAGVQTMHMTASALPASVTAQVAAVPGVQEAVPILYATDTIQAQGNEYLAYVFGVPDGAVLGRPSNVVDGAAMPGSGEIIIDRSIADQAGLRVGDRVTVLGQDLTIAGLTSGTSTIASSVAVVRMDDFVRARGGGQAISFVLVKVNPGESPADVASRITGSVNGVTVQTRQQFAAQERKQVKDMTADILNVMNYAGFLTGLAVVALTIYIAIISRRKEYGVLKAMGTRNNRLYGVVVTQALMSVAAGFAGGIGVTLLLSVLIPLINESMVLSVGAASLVRVGIAVVIIGGLSALLPARQLARLEPAAIVRRG